MEKVIIYNSPFGALTINYTEQYITSIQRLNDQRATQNPNTHLLKTVFTQLDEYFNGQRKKFDFVYRAEGTNFQKKVWKALCDIPYGETRSYKDIAIAIGNAKACRAVGLANNKNPISIAIPCHRVIASSGKLAGYGGGLDMKQGLLDLEAGKLKL